MFNNISYNKLGHVPSLDGLRAIAVILVMMAHANFQLGDNGILGVDIFFALSGFLITTLLLEEYADRNSISLRAFYVRRIFRLFPALYAMLLVLLVYAVLFRAGNDLCAIKKEILSSALYVYNISFSWGWGDKGFLLGHTWSLAVEEQFYLLWPFALLTGLYFKKIKKIIIWLVIFIILLFLVKNYIAIPYVFKAIFSESIFIGCLAALFRWQAGRIKSIPDYITLFLLCTIIFVGLFPIDWYQKIYESGGRSIIGLITSCIIIFMVNNPTGPVSRVLSKTPMVWIGKISYALYLWHVPVFAIFRYHSTLPPSASFILKFIVTFALAGLSWFLIEKRATEFGRAVSKKILNDRRGTNIKMT